MRKLVLIIAVLALVIAGFLGWQGWQQRPVGTPQAVEFADVELGPELTGATVLGLGEATHGNHEFQVFRQQLVHKASRYGFHALVLEEDFGSTQLADRFIQGGPGSDEDAANSLGFRINKTREVAGLLQWLREHNAQVPAEQRIHLYGMDVQRVNANKHLALEWLRTRDPAAAEDLDGRLTALTDDRRSEADLVRAAQPAIEQLAETLRTHAQPGDPAYAIAVRAAETLRQGARLSTVSQQDYGRVRDQFMADNLTWIVDHESPRGRVVLNGHNGHLDKTSAAYPHPNVGQLAAQKWGDRYRVIGTEYHHSTFLSGQGTRRTQFSVTNNTPLRGIYTGTGQGYLEFAGADARNRELLQRSLPMGSAGESFAAWMGVVPGFSTVNMVPTRAYDALILVERATPVTMLPS